MSLGDEARRLQARHGHAISRRDACDGATALPHFVFGHFRKQRYYHALPRLGESGGEPATILGDEGLTAMLRHRCIKGPSSRPGSFHSTDDDDDSRRQPGQLTQGADTHSAGNVFEALSTGAGLYALQKLLGRCVAFHATC